MEAAFFDLDKTVIAKASMAAFGRPLLREGFISRRLLLRGLWANLVYVYFGADEQKMAEMRDKVLRITEGWQRDELRQLIRESLEEVIEPIVYAEALDLIREHQAAGRRVYIVSASPEEIVEPLADFLGVPHVIATRARVDDTGRYTGSVELYAYGPTKAAIMADLAEAEGIDLGASYAYSDSATDVPMLEAVGHPVVVNPDRALLRAARERGWEVREFVHPVRLRHRVPYRPAVAVGAVAIGAAGGAAAVMWARRARWAAGPTGQARAFLTPRNTRAASTAMMRSFFMGRERSPGSGGAARPAG